MNQLIDMAFIAAKMASMNDEKARIIVNGASMAYSVSQISRLKSLVTDYYQLVNVIAFQARMRGYYTNEECQIVTQCKVQIEDCNAEITKYGIMTFIDGVTLLIDGFNQLEQQKVDNNK